MQQCLITPIGLIREIAYNCLGICVCHSSETLQANSPNFLCFQSGPSSAMQNRVNCSSYILSAIISIAAKPPLKCVQYVRLCTYTVQCTYANSAFFWRTYWYRYRNINYRTIWTAPNDQIIESNNLLLNVCKGRDGDYPPPPRIGKWNKTRTYGSVGTPSLRHR